MARGKYEKQPQKTRLFLWLGIALTLAALLLLYMIGAFVMQGIRVRNKGKEDAAQYLQTVPAAKETPPTTAPAEEETENTSETTEPTTEPETEPTEPPRFPLVDFAGLQAKNADVVGWLQVPALSIIDYPVVIGEDNAFYTEHDWEKNESENGAVFLDFRLDRGFTNIHTILYAHAMKDGTMFHDLGKFEGKSFREQNDNTILLYTPEETRVYTIFAIERVDALDKRAYRTDAEPGESWLKDLEDTVFHSQFSNKEELKEDSETITLSTCVGGATRLAVHGILTERVPYGK